MHRTMNAFRQAFKPCPTEEDSATQCMLEAEDRTEAIFDLIDSAVEGVLEFESSSV